MCSLSSPQSFPFLSAIRRPSAFTVVLFAGGTHITSPRGRQELHQGNRPHRRVEIWHMCFVNLPYEITKPRAGNFCHFSMSTRSAGRQIRSTTTLRCIFWKSLEVIKCMLKTFMLYSYVGHANILEDICHATIHILLPQLFDLCLKSYPSKAPKAYNQKKPSQGCLYVLALHAWL